MPQDSVYLWENAKVKALRAFLKLELGFIQIQQYLESVEGFTRNGKASQEAFNLALAVIVH